MKKFIPFAVLLILIVAGCKNEKNGSEIPEGEDTSLTLLIQTAQISGARAGGDPNATAKEINLKTATIFIFNTLRQLEIVKTLTAADFTFDNGVYTAKAQFPAKTGKKYIYAGINIPDPMIDVISNSGPNQIYNLGTEPEKLYDDSDADGSFGMFNEQEQQFNVRKEPGYNTFTIPVSRMATKITMVKTATVEDNYQKADFDMTTLAFAMGNKNTKIYPLQQPRLSSGDVVDPNWNGEIIAGRIKYQDDFISDPFASTSPSPWITLVEKGPDATSLTPKYALENTSDLQLKGETTYAAVRVKFTIVTEATWDAVNSQIEEAPYNGGATPAQVFVLSIDDQYYLFTVEADAQAAYAANNGSKLRTYTDGWCYYHVWLNPNGNTSTAPSYQAFRNDYYAMTVTAIDNFGKYSPEIDNEDKTDPIDDDTDLAIDIQVIKWNLVDDDVRLGR